MSSSRECDRSTPPLMLSSYLEPKPGVGDSARNNSFVECIPTAVNERVVTYPPPSDNESAKKTRWFEERFFSRIAVQEFLPLAAAARADGQHLCWFGPRQ